MTKQRSAAVAVLFLGVCWLVYGCGSLGSLSPGGSPAARPGRRPAPIIRKFVATAEPGRGLITFHSSDEGAASSPGQASTRARQIGALDGISLSGRATPAAGGVLSGSVTLKSDRGSPLFDVRAVVASISTSSVTIRNADGTTPLLGGSRSYWSYGTLNPGATSGAKTWQFNVPNGVNFTFTVFIYANVWSYSRGDGGGLNDAYFLDTSTGWAVGDAGKILATSDGGATWTAQIAPTRADLRAVWFVNANRGWAVGSEETILCTDNGGRTWRVQINNPGSPAGFNAIQMVDERYGWAAGDAGMLVDTENGGQSWIYEDSGTVADIYGISLANVETGWIVGNNVFRRTVDGFEWKQMTLPSGASTELRGVAFSDALKGVAVGKNGTVLQTTNGGTTWKKVSAGTTTTQFNGVAFASPTVGWVVGAGGSIRRMDANPTTGTLTLTTQTSPIATDLVSAWCVRGNTTFCCALGAGGVAIRTTNGSTWVRTAGGATTTWTGIDWPDRRNGWVTGAGGPMMRTTDGGETWSPLPGSPTGMADVNFLTPTLGWACGSSGAVARTTDGGNTWTSQSTGLSTSTALNSIRFLDSQRGWAVGSSSAIIRTTNGGASWVKVPSPVTGRIFQRIVWISDTTGWIAGSAGMILRTTDGGATWTPCASSTPKNLYCLRMLDQNIGYAVGAAGVILKTTNGGVSWTVQPSGQSTDLNGVDFVDTNQGWAVGAGGIVLRTTNGGASWSLIDAGTDNDLFEVFFHDADDGWIVGAGGVLKRLN
jgi:photosystem II stability/assembly factor-like uncharacterized protein